MMAEQQLPPQGLLVPTGMLTPGFSASQLNGILQGSASLVSQLALKVVTYIQQVLADAVQTYQDVGLKVVTPIANTINAAQSTAQQLGTQVRNQLAASVNSATSPCDSGCTAEQGAKPNQFQYNIWQDYDVPQSVFVENRDYPISRDKANLCFRAGWDSYYDGINYKASIQGTPAPEWCKLPGGIATGTPPVQHPNGNGTTETLGCPVGRYNVWIKVGPDGQSTGCTMLCVTDPQPPNTVPGGLNLSYDVAIGVMESSQCAPGSSGGGPKWYAGCVNGQPAIWNDTQSPPAGVTGTIGPFDTQAAATAAINCPPTNGHNGNQGQCCDSITVNFPTNLCLTVDLCDWSKFKKALVEALCEWYEKCVCKLDNQTSYQISDCDGVLQQSVDAWKGAVGSVVTDNTVDGIISQGQTPIEDDTFNLIGNDPDPWS